MSPGDYFATAGLRSPEVDGREKVTRRLFPADAISDMDRDGTPASAGSAFSDARFVDTSGNPRIGILMEIAAALSRAVEPREVLQVFSQRGRELYGPRGHVAISQRGLPAGRYRITPVQVLDGTTEMRVADPWMLHEALPVRGGGFFGRLIREPRPHLVHHLELRNDPVVGDDLAGWRSLMAIPLFDGGAAVNWAVFLRREPEGFDEQELEQAIMRANLVGTAVKSALIAKELREAHAQREREIRRIASIQRSLLPHNLPQIPGLSIAASYEVFDTAGGDYYDFRPLTPDGSLDTFDPDGPWGIIIADASGHGPSAAVVMAMLQSILHAYPRTPEGPNEVLEHINRHLCSKRIESSFVTAFFAVYEPRRRRLAYARAGHNPPLIRDAGPQGRISPLEDVGGVPLGILEDTTYESAQIELHPGQTVLLYTDGVTEALSRDGKMFGLAGVTEALRGSEADPAGVVESINGPLRRHVRGCQPNDDQTIVAICAEKVSG